MTIHGIIHQLAFVPGLAALIAVGMGVGLLLHKLAGWINGRRARLEEPKAPSEDMVALARRIARERNVPLPEEILQSFERTRGFLNAYSRDVHPPR